ncbi:MAG: YceD family protein [Desulfobacteraceae bacterium]
MTKISLLKIPIEKIPEEGIDIPVRLGSEWFAHWLDQEPGLEFYLESPLKGSIRLEKPGDYLLVRGVLKGELRLNCSRCLESFLQSLECRFDLLLKPGPPPETEEERELSAEELGEDYYSGDELDLERIIQEQILLAVPLKPLCREACLGLCPHCGINLNRDTCSCRGVRFNQPFAVLNKLKKSSK